MRFSTALVASGLAALVYGQTAAQVTTDIQTIQADINTFSTQLDTLSDQGNPDDNIPAFVEIYTTSQQLIADLDKATQDTQASPQFTQSEAISVGVEALKLPDLTEALLSKRESKKPIFDRGAQGQSLSPLVLQNLQTSRTSAANLGAALKEKLGPDFADQADQVNSRIDAAFAKAIATYEQPADGGSTTTTTTTTTDGGPTTTTTTTTTSATTPTITAPPTVTVTQPGKTVTKTKPPVTKTKTITKVHTKTVYKKTKTVTHNKTKTKTVKVCPTSGGYPQHYAA